VIQGVRELHRLVARPSGFARSTLKHQRTCREHPRAYAGIVAAERRGQRRIPIAVVQGDAGAGILDGLFQPALRERGRPRRVERLETQPIVSAIRECPKLAGQVIGGRQIAATPVEEPQPEQRGEAAGIADPVAETPRP
jgi:hypothetical protein